MAIKQKRIQQNGQVYLERLSILGFKGFRKTQVFSFAVPNQKIGGGITVIVGPNNSGKSTIFDALLRFTINKKIFANERNRKNVILRFWDTAGKSKTAKNNGSQIVLSGDSVLSDKPFEYIGSRRGWQYRFGGGRNNYDSYVESKYRETNKDSIDSSLGPLLATIHSDPEQKEALTKMMRDLVHNFTDWAVDSDENGDFIKYTTRDKEHNANLLGDGVISLFRIAAQLINTDGQRIMLIDEPELSLHPQVQRRLAAFLARQAISKQIIIATHSPYFIRLFDLKNGAKLVRVNKPRDKECEVKELSLTTLKELLKLTNQWQQPYLFDTVAKETFFSNAVVFLEGVVDVGLIRQYIEINNIYAPYDIFGYGVNGAGMMFSLLKLAEELGIERAGVLDGGQKALYKKCHKRFTGKRGGIVLQFSTNDIYDKGAKQGIFSNRGVVHQDKKAELDSVLKQLSDHFDSRTI